MVKPASRFCGSPQHRSNAPKGSATEAGTPRVSGRSDFSSDRCSPLPPTRSSAVNNKQVRKQARAQSAALRIGWWSALTCEGGVHCGPHARLRPSAQLHRPPRCRHPARSARCRQCLRRRGRRRHLARRVYPDLCSGGGG
eukprot:7683657-Pyramimonas_sp.AAC.1